MFNPSGHSRLAFIGLLMCVALYMHILVHAMFTMSGVHYEWCSVVHFKCLYVHVYNSFETD